MTTTPARITLAAPLLIALSATAAERVIDSAAGANIDIPAAGAIVPVTFTNAPAPATGFAIDADWVAVVADNGGGTFPWSVDLSVSVQPPHDSAALWGPEIFGDITIAGYPMQDGAQLFSGTNTGGQYIVTFDSGAPSPWVAGLRDVTYYLTTTVPDVTHAYSATPDPMQTWNRPFFIAGVSGQGPVAYDAFRFTVETSGVYDFQSVLAPTANHFTFLYENDFDPTLPLTNLLDYGLGNGFSPFNVPNGTSRFSALLFEGVTYTWVTSQWAFFSAINPSTNTIVGPGEVFPAGTEPCTGDCDGSGAVDFNDLVTMLFEFGNSAGPDCDADDSGAVDFNDLVAALFLFGPCA
ncbi:MAG: hypothetical protein RLN60_01705 [Phycisphaerales bacterium]